MLLNNMVNHENDDGSILAPMQRKIDHMKPLFIVDEEKCSKDGICAAECPLAIINFSDRERVPQPSTHAEALCIECGHCVAVCPHGALTHRNLSPEDCPAVDKEMILDEKQTEHFLRHRRSIRTYKNRPIEKEKLEKLITMASYAPSGHNSQPVHWQVINGKDKVTELSAHVIDWMRHTLKERPDFGKMMHFDTIIAAWKLKIDVVSRGCSALVLTNGGAKDPFADAACRIAMTFFDLAVPSMGLGSCWNGYFNRAALEWPPLKKALGLSEHMANYGAMMVGYPKFTYPRMPTRHAPKITWTE